MSKNFKKHLANVTKLAELVTIHNIQMYAIDVNKWSINEPYSDPENFTIYRETLEELAEATYVDEDCVDHTHYPNPPYSSIWDY